MFHIALAVVGSLVLARPCVSVAPQSLEELIRFSDRIVVGRVERIVAIPRDPLDARRDAGALGVPGWQPSLPIAEVRVHRTLHGPHQERVHFLACGTWTCDISGANEGEEVLLFLDDSRWMAVEGSSVLAALGELANAAPVFQVAHSGRGSMPIRTVAERAYATAWTCDVTLPDDMPTIDGPEPEYEFIRSVPLDELERAIVRTSRKVFPRLSAHVWSEDPSKWEFSVMLWSDGRVFLSEHREDDWRRDWFPCRDDRWEWALMDSRGLAKDARWTDHLAAPYSTNDRSMSYLGANDDWTLQGAAIDREPPPETEASRRMAPPGLWAFLEDVARTPPDQRR